MDPRLLKVALGQRYPPATEVNTPSEIGPVVVTIDRLDRPPDVPRAFQAVVQRADVPGQCPGAKALVTGTTGMLCGQLGVLRPLRLLAGQDVREHPREVGRGQAAIVLGPLELPGH